MENDGVSQTIVNATVDQAKNTLSEFLDDLKNQNIDSLALVYAKKDGKMTSYINGGNRMLIIGILEQLKFDVVSKI